MENHKEIAVLHTPITRLGGAIPRTLQVGPIRIAWGKHRARELPTRARLESPILVLGGEKP